MGYPSAISIEGASTSARLIVPYSASITMSPPGVPGVTAASLGPSADRTNFEQLLRLPFGSDLSNSRIYYASFTQHGGGINPRIDSVDRAENVGTTWVLMAGQARMAVVRYTAGDSLSGPFHFDWIDYGVPSGGGLMSYES